MTSTRAPDAGSGPAAGIEFAQWVRPGDADLGRRAELIACWREVSNAGGAAGFPFPPVTEVQVGTAVDALLGWREAGRWPEALRPAPDDLRDEIHIVLAPL